ncbi:MAG: DUF805 domain-containing protein, partial [Actinomycetota bacterium]|nr:DUF805 domain-containing protein [Actinomycetota bacterium]
SLAAVMYKMITGEAPPGAQTRIYALLSDKKDPYRALADQDLAEYDYHFLHTIDAALSVDANQRPQTVQKFQAAILGEVKAPISIPTQAISSAGNPPKQSGLFSFEGRINRLKYWLNSLIPLVIVFLSVIPVIVTAKEGQGASGFASLLMMAGWAAAIWISLAIQVKRWHDLDQSGWWVLLGFVPYVNIIVMIILGFIKGTVGRNRFGDDPLGSVYIDNAATGQRSTSQTQQKNDAHPAEPIASYGSSVTLLGIGHRIPSVVLTPNREMIVGRSNSVDIRIDNKYISGKHIALMLDGSNRVQVRDLSSTNGTYIEGKKLEPNIPYELHHGESIVLGSEDVVYAL